MPEHSLKTYRGFKLSQTSALGMLDQIQAPAVFILLESVLDAL
jgi:hypothetical protein